MALYIRALLHFSLTTIYISRTFFKDVPTSAIYVCLFEKKILLASRIRTRIVRVEGEYADH